MNKIESKFRFTVEDRILVHLLGFLKFGEEVEVPPGMTQQGIASAVGIERKHVPRSLKGMLDKGLLVERTKHVTGKTQRMKTYALTQKGDGKARKLRNHVRDIWIRVKDAEGGMKEVAIGEVGELVEGPYSLARVLSCISPDGVFDAERASATKKSEKRAEKRDNLEIYRKALEQAWKDGKMTVDERDLLASLRESLDISEGDHLKLEERILVGVERATDGEAAEVYKVALEQALADGKITEDERAILEKIKERFNIGDV